MTLTGTLKEPINNTVYASSTLSFEIIIYDPSLTFIKPSPIDQPPPYTIGDPEIIISIPYFQCNKAYLTPKYQLLNSDGTLPDPTLMKFDLDLMQVKV